MSSSRRSSVGGERPKDSTRLRIEQMEAEREERRRTMLERKQERAEEDKRNKAAGNPGDVDFIRLVRKWREVHSSDARPHDEFEKYEQPRICICVRKRPISEKEVHKHDHDSVTCLHPLVWVHSAKLRVDGISKYLDHSSFRFDHAFDESVSTDEVYRHSAMPLIDFVCAGNGGRATVFAYGQTGSGKTYTMEGIQKLVSEDLFLLLSSNEHAVEGGCSFDDTQVTVAFFEIYGGFVQDLLNNRKRLKILEDGKGEIVVSGLEEFEANDPSHFLNHVAAGNKMRTTHATEANDTSSRSHAICQILLRDKATSKLRGKLSLVDLAGSERGTDTKSHNSQRRNESSEINTSLLALKECIRALEGGNKTKHVPYRASKLTLILKDCFTSKQARTTMIATVSPGASSADHTLNTLRYADRIKENKVSDKNIPGAAERASRPRAKATERSRAQSLPVTSRSTKQVEERAAPIATSSRSKSNDEAELRRVVQALFEQEENLLNMHMGKIQENAELLTEEGKMLQQVQGEDASEADNDQYVARLSTILDRKTHLIEVLNNKMVSFRSHLKKEEELSKKVGSLSQY